MRVAIRCEFRISCFEFVEIGTRGGIRTLTPLRALRPERSASASSATLVTELPRRRADGVSTLEIVLISR